MGTSRIRFSFGRATVFAALGVLALSGAAAAQTAEQRAACTPDAMRLCSSAIPDVGRVTACMQAHRSSLSARCQAAMPGAAPATIQASARPPRPHERVATAPQPTTRRQVVMVGHHRRIIVAESIAPRHRRHVASGGGFNFGGSRSSRQGMMMAVQVMSALSSACQNQGMSGSQMCGVMNSMGGMGGMGALAGFMR